VEVYPIKNYGGMQFATHRFHHPGHEREFPGARALGMSIFLTPRSTGVARRRSKVPTHLAAERRTLKLLSVLRD